MRIADLRVGGQRPGDVFPACRWSRPARATAASEADLVPLVARLGDEPRGFAQGREAVTARRNVVVAARVVSLAIALFACAATSALGQTPIRWILADEYPATSLPGEGDAYFAKAVADRVAGKLVVESQPDAKSGFRSREQLKAVAEGKLAMADSF